MDTTNHLDPKYSWRVTKEGEGGVESNITLTNLDAATLVALGYTVVMNKSR
jgi:hypothetical protein